NGRYARADPTRVVWDARSQQRRSFLDRHTRQRLRMEVGFHTLAPVIHGVHFVAAAVDLDPAHLPAQLAELFLQFLLRLPRVLRARVASREASRRNRRRGEQREAHGGTNRRSNKRDFHTELLCERASRIVPGSARSSGTLDKRSTNTVRADGTRRNGVRAGAMEGGAAVRLANPTICAGSLANVRTRLCSEAFVTLLSCRYRADNWLTRRRW